MILYCADHDTQFDTDTDTETHRFCHGTDGELLSTPRSWAPEFMVDGKWCGNAQRFATKEEAEGSARKRFMAWTVPSDWRAAPTDDRVNYEWDAETGDRPMNCKETTGR